MNQILDLREKRAKLWEDTKAFLDSKRDDAGLISAEDTASYDKMEARRRPPWQRDRDGWSARLPWTSSSAGR